MAASIGTGVRVYFDGEPVGDIADIEFPTVQHSDSDVHLVGMHEANFSMEFMPGQEDEIRQVADQSTIQCRVDLPPTKIWEFPKERFVIYEDSDESWCRALGIGREIEVPTFIELRDCQIKVDGNIATVTPQVMEMKHDIEIDSSD